MSFLLKKTSFQIIVFQLIADMRQSFSDLRQPFFWPSVHSPSILNIAMEKDLTLTNSCWVYIMEYDKKKRQIGLTGNLQKSIQQVSKGKPVGSTTAGKLVFYRCFPDTLSALGFRLLLLRLSDSSVERIVHSINPAKTDLAITVLSENNYKTSKY